MNIDDLADAAHRTAQACLIEGDYDDRDVWQQVVLCVLRHVEEQCIPKPREVMHSKGYVYGHDAACLSFFRKLQELRQE